MFCEKNSGLAGRVLEKQGMHVVWIKKYLFQ